MFVPGLSMIKFQSIVASSSLKVSEQKCEKSRFLICLCLILSIVDARIQNYEKWLLTSVIRLPLTTTWSGLLSEHALAYRSSE